MIVDLVWNDFLRIVCIDSVEVIELFGVYIFEIVYQMIFEVICCLCKDILFFEILVVIFFMGSMMGVLKVFVVIIFDWLEQFLCGIYLGSIGVIFFDGDFEFNVMICLLVYDKFVKWVSCGVGGVIIIVFDLEDEYWEC